MTGVAILIACLVLCIIAGLGAVLLALWLPPMSISPAAVCRIVKKRWAR